MREFLVVTSVSAAHGRGVSGHTLAGFLRTYAGRRAVETCTPDELLAGGPRSAKTVFLGLPSPAGERHLARLRHRHLVLFDLHDHHYPLWDDANRELLRSASGLYLKCWTDERWDFGIRMGLAPVRRYAKLRLAVEAGRLRRGLGLPEPDHRYDALFLGAATGRDPRGADPALVPNQRVSWLLELRDQAPELKVWGGLLARSVSPGLQERYGDLSRFVLRGKVPFHRYFAALRRSRVALTPEGNAPWSYRHYEAIYARSLLVTCDFRRLHTLVPLPSEGMVHVEDGAPVLPALERALRLRRERPEILEENVRFLERFLAGGLYSRRRPELWERFVAQLPR
ncbi:MAG: hypothetical protein HZB56_06530 [Deltaproteobacteria bacterium]|nr:hypothetical protein [Deltaproteobacteria bacterium]